MEQTYLVQLIKLMGTEEREEALSFCTSTFFQNPGSKEEGRLFAMLLECAPNFTGEQIKKENIYARLFPGESLIAGKLEKVMVGLSKRIRTYMLMRHYLRKENEFFRELEWAKLTRERGLEARFRQSIGKLLRDLEEQKDKNIEYFYRRFLLEYEQHDLESYYNRKKGNLNIPNVLGSLDMFYHINRLELLNRLLLQEKVAKANTPEEFSYDFAEVPLPDRYLEESILLLITNKIHHLLKAQQPNVDEFHSLVDLLQKHEQILAPGLIQQYYTYLRSLSVFLISIGFNELLPVFLRILQQNLEKGLLYYEGKISSGTMANVTNVALRAKAFDWALHFIESHKDRIIGDNESHDYYRLNLANYHFAVGDFEKALDLIPSTLQDWDYQFIARRLRLKVYYETESDLLPYEVDAFKMFVSRASKKVPSVHFRQLQSNFINLLFQIIHLPLSSKGRAQRLIQRIEAKKVVADKDWLIEKARKLA